jgi:hypothetical protein
VAADQVAAVPLAEVPSEAEEDKHSNSHRYNNAKAPFGAPFVCPILHYDKDNIYDTLLRNISSVIYATVLDKIIMQKNWMILVRVLIKFLCLQ